MIMDKISELRTGRSFIKKKKNDILYITGCTKKKDISNEDLFAFDRYQGPASRNMLQFFKKSDGRKILDMYVMSAGYGFIPADIKIRNYNVTFANTTAKLKRYMAVELDLKKDYQNLLDKGYKLIILRLGPDYIKALQYAAPEGYDTSKGTVVCYLKTKKNKQKINAKTIEIPDSESINGGYQDRIWSKFFKKNKDLSSDEIIQKVINSKNIKELLQ